MVLYYAFGGGLGHLTRANAVVNTLGFNTDDFLVLTSSNYSDYIFESKNVIKISDQLYSKPSELKAQIEKIIYKQKIDSFFIDSFPAGINGELNNLKINNCKLYYVARLLNWKNYQNFVLNFELKFETTYLIENLKSEQLDFINQHTTNCKSILLKYPYSGNLETVKLIFDKASQPVWLIVHSGNFNELQQLYKYAIDVAELDLVSPYYLIISQSSPELEINSGIQINYYPASDFFPFVERIITACGYNSIAQTLQYVDKHYFIPFERKFDDQYARAKARKILINRA